MDGLINKLKKGLVSKIQNIRITKFNSSLTVNGKGVIKSITGHMGAPYGDELIIIIDNESPLTIKINEVYTFMTSSGVCIFTLNEAISFDKRFEIKCNNNIVWGSVTYTTEQEG